MKFEISTKPLTDIKAQSLIVGLFEDGQLTETEVALDMATKGLLSELAADKTFFSKENDVIRFHRPDGLNVSELIVVDLGKIENFDDTVFEKAFQTALAATPSQHVAVSVLDWLAAGRTVEWTVMHMARLALTQHEPIKLEKVNENSPRKVTLLVNKNTETVKDAFYLGEAIGHAVNEAKYLGNLPPNVCTPSYLGEVAKSYKKLKGVTVTFHDHKETDRIGMHDFLAVARGSEVKPRFIELHYAGGKKNDAPICFVGKGITFDAGGICLKAKQRIAEMKYDMCGAATVLAVFHACASMKLPLNIIALIPACENLPDGNAYRPADVIDTLAGLTVEIANTDAEGRLVMCDAMTYSARFEPEALIDVATLTGAVGTALGDHFTGLFVNDPMLCGTLETAADVAIDPVWTLPFNGAHFKSRLKSNIADCANTGPAGGAGASVAATFLAQFVPEDTSWAHLDIDATAYVGGKLPHSTGRPVGLLLTWLHQMAHARA